MQYSENRETTIAFIEERKEFVRKVLQGEEREVGVNYNKS